MRILLVAATSEEAGSFRKIAGDRNPDGIFSFGRCDFEVLVTGVGSVATAWALTKWFCSNPGPDLVINAGIAGSFKNEFPVGEVVVPVSECFADAGIETGRGFQTLFETGLQDPGGFPFREGRIISENRYVSLAIKQLKPVRAITVNTATGTDETVNNLILKFNPDIETMEGAAFFYVCSKERVPFLAFRSVSNRVEPRNRDKWDIPLAISKLSEKLEEFILILD